MKAENTIENSHSHYKKVAAHFSKAATQYEQSAQLQQHIATELLQKLSTHLKANPILDLGCGTAYCTPHLQNVFPEASVFSLDVSFKMLKQAKTSPGLLCANMEQLPFTTQSIDLVFANMSLQWSSNLMHNFSEIKRILKDGGHFLFSLPGPFTLIELKHCWQQVDDGAHVNHFTSSLIIQQQLKKLGFKNIQLTEKKYELEYASVLDLMRHLKTSGTDCVLKQRRTLTGKHKFKQMIEHYEQLRQANGSLPCTYDIIFVEAQL